MTVNLVFSVVLHPPLNSLASHADIGLGTHVTGQVVDHVLLIACGYQRDLSDLH